ncbi:MAG TPA: hypothetical protein VI434_03590 [Candidatus Dormibacteraeota bacterium]
MRDGTLTHLPSRPADAIVGGIFGGGSGNHIIQVVIIIVVVTAVIAYFVLRLRRGSGAGFSAGAPVVRQRAPSAEGADAGDATLRLVRMWTSIIGAPNEEWSIAIDGIVVGSIANNETVEVAVEPGHHTLRLGSGRHRSAEPSFDVARQEVVGFNCHGPRYWPLLLVALVNPKIWISLKRD